MATYSSDHNVHASLDTERLSTLLAEYLHKNLNLDSSEEGHSFWILNGDTLIIEENSTVEDDIFVTRAWIEATALANAMQVQQKEKARQDALAKKATEQKQALEQRRHEYERLQREFGHETK